MDTFGVQPDKITYNSLMTGWIQTKAPEAAEKVQSLLDDLNRKHEAGHKALNPDLQVFSTIITAWGRSLTEHGNRAAPTKAQAVYDNMITRFKLYGAKHLKPDLAILNAILFVWGQAGEPEMAKNIFSREMRLYRVTPNHFSYSSMITAWYRSGRADTAEHIQALYDDMMRKYMAGDANLKPDPRLCDVVIRSWCKSSIPDAKSKAKRFFHSILEAHGRGYLDESRIRSWRKLIEEGRIGRKPH